MMFSDSLLMHSDNSFLGITIIFKTLFRINILSTGSIVVSIPAFQARDPSSTLGQCMFVHRSEQVHSVSEEPHNKSESNI